MPSLFSRLSLGLRAARELGLRQVAWYALYQIGLRSGHIRRATPISAYADQPGPLYSPFALPDRAALHEVLSGEPRGQAVLEAEELLFGQIRLFGGPPVLLNLRHPAGIDPQQHWTIYEGHPERAGVDDFKFLWEPARFGLVFPLARAYAITGDERYPAVFWNLLENFLPANPPNTGANWASAQEVALRLVAFVFAGGVFAASPHSTPARMARLAGAIAAHAARIPATLSYARAQKNNHLISEALGLIAAGSALPDHPQSAGWKQLGERCLHEGLLRQIHPNGVYAQHSTNYHRLMLHAALLARAFGTQISPAAAARLPAATHWLLAQVDPASGRAPNLGANDGANLLPLAADSFADYRPTLQAAARAFLGKAALPPGRWDELSLWLGQEPLPLEEVLPAFPAAPGVLRLGAVESWATLRAAQFRERPSHADQLHVELWWQGQNVALDAGSYRYTDEPPWDHGLARTLVHNTLTVNGQDQMRRVGRFLWLDWAQAKDLMLDPQGRSMHAQHNGYRQWGLVHQRSVEQHEDGWLISDLLLAAPGARPDPVDVELHWLLPDWPWQIEAETLVLRRPGGRLLRLTLSSAQSGAEIQLVRCGRLLAGAGSPAPLRGWVSPTYSMKIPALSFTLITRTIPPCQLESRWTFSE